MYNKSMRAAFVVQRYGKEVIGGAEKLARDYAERLYIRGWDITVYTTTALDYITWANHYSVGESILHGVRIKRYPVEKERNIDEFNHFSEEFFSEERNREEEEYWLELQGPVSPQLVEAISREHKDYDLVIFFTYLYYPTYYGLKEVGKSAILFPTAHDEPPFHMGIMREVFTIPCTLLFLSEEEKELVDRYYPAENRREVIGAGIEPPSQFFTKLFLDRFLLYPPFILYMGRIDEGKGCNQMLECFIPYANYRPSLFALAGKLNMELPADPRIRYLGYLPERVKWDAIKASTLTVHPSSLESFSYFLLESLSVGVPGIVNEKSPVLKGHIERSNAGLTYKDCPSFASALELLLSEPELYNYMGEQGRKYVMENFSWEVVLSRLSSVL